MMNKQTFSVKPVSTDLPVLLSPAQSAGSTQYLDSNLFSARTLLYLLLAFTIILGVAEAQEGRESVISIIIKWTPLLFKSFMFNILISVMSMLIGTLLGAGLGLMQISLIPSIRFSSWAVTQFFRNAPWLVLLFFAMLMLPFELKFGDTIVSFPDWIKAVIGLSLPVMANVSEIVRGAVRSIPDGQWEASEAMAYTRSQQLWSIILPQCYKRMLPPWMNLYAILTMATVLASLVGVNEVLTTAKQMSAAEGGRIDLLAPLYGYILLWFFFYCYPISLITQKLEKRFALKI
ncbi:MAG: ABC transporter permease subunit [Cocleimonas sp.]|nr:ABC transporter permease subunit [Cocleimonas sp.]